MGKVIGDILPFAVGVAINPIPIIAVILLLLTPSARKNSLAFLAGWLFGLTVVSVIVLVLAANMDNKLDNGPTTWTSILRLVLGGLLFFAAYRQWKKRPNPGEEPEMPKWMAAIDRFTVPKAAGLAALLSGANPKILAFTLAMGLAVAKAELNTGKSIVVLAVYIIIASATVTAPVLLSLVMGEKATGTLYSIKGWLTANNATVMFILFLVLGAVLLGNGISGLT